MNVQIFGTKKCNDTKKAQRYFKERGIKFQFVDMSEKEISKGEFRSVCQAVGGINAMINEDCKDKDALALVNFGGPKGREASGESAGDKDTDCQKRKAGDSWVCTRGLEGLELN